MSFSQTYKFDVFVSYASADDIDVSGRGDGWIAEFVNYLRPLLCSRLGGTDDLKIFHDKQSLSGNHSLDTLLDAARNSALFLSVASSAYRDRDWTQKELQAFCEGQDFMERLFVIEYMPLRPKEKFEEPLASRKRIQFWSSDSEYGVDMTLQMGETDYRKRANQLSAQIADRLVTLRAQPKASEGQLPGKPDSNGDGGLGPSAVKTAHDPRKDITLVIGRTASDMDVYSERIGGYFTNLGYTVIDAADLRQGGADFNADLGEKLSTARVFLVPIGNSAGRMPPDLPQGYYAAQIEQARDTPVQTIIWRRPDVSSATASTPSHGALLDGPEVTVASYSAILDQVRGILEQAVAKTPEPGPTVNGAVLINASKEDRLAALRLQEQLAEHGVDAFVPLFDGDATEIREALTKCMTDCDAVLLLYGDVGLNWLWPQLMQFSKLRPRMQARLKAVLVGPPTGKPKDIGFRAQDVQILDVSPDWDSRKVLDLVGAMK